MPLRFRPFELVIVCREILGREKPQTFDKKNSASERWCPPGHGAMYNGIGLPTPRGSGTNGYVQRNLSLVRGRRGERPDYKGEEELRRLEAALVKRPNPDILDHERKRRVELRCLELEEMMEEQGYEEQQIQEKVATFRLMLLEKDVNPGGKEETPGQRPAVTETHQLAELNEKKNERLRAAFGISDSYVDGSSFDPQRRAREAKQPVPEPPKPYSLVRESSSSRSPTPKQKKKKKKKDRGRRSESSSPRRERKKSSKKKKHRSESESKKRKHRSPTPKSKRKSKDKKRKRSRSTTPAPKSRRAHRSSSADSASSSDTSCSRRCTDHSEDTVPAL
ncbi:serine/arginine repetitive matrix protein 2 isoform 10-T13 [Hipposideros larvatus]